MSYFDGYLIPIPTEKLEAIRIVDCVLDADATDGAQFHAEEARDALNEAAEPLRDFQMAAAIEAGETVVLSWTEWPSKAARDSGLAKALSDPVCNPRKGRKSCLKAVV